MRRIITLLVENEAGALCRIANLFSSRGYNIESLSVATTNDESVSRMTIVSSGSTQVVEQIVKQLNKLIDVIKVMDITDGNHIERELLLVKVSAVGATRDEVKRLVDIFRGRIVDVTESIYTIELTGASAKIEAFLDALVVTRIIEVVRSGVSGIARGDRALSIN
ncbi:acetolactate synthase small subunit [Gammaproteobacteria bacterium]|nr:acetolactate synthase small subunit [Gammaproteobacteria bacterium]